MIKTLLLLTILLPTIVTAQTKPLVFTHVTVIDMVDANPKTDMTVIIESDRITSVGRTNKVRMPKNAQVIDARGKFLIPGLWDMHVHALRPERVGYFFPLFVANGVTGIRDMGTTAEGFAALSQLRQEIAAGTRIGPRIIAAGRILDGAKPAVPENSIPFTNETEARQAVRFLKQAGADFIKVYDGIPRASYFAIADEAKKQRMPFAGHIPTGGVTSFEASDTGQKSFEHLGTILQSCSRLDPKAIDERVRATIRPGNQPNDLSAIPLRIAARTKIELETYSEQKCAQLFARFVKNKTWQVPTLTIKQAIAFADSMPTDDPRRKYIPLATLERWKPENNLFLQYGTPESIETRKRLFEKEVELVGIMHRAGVKFMAGTDVPGPHAYPGFSLHDELGLLVRAGFTPFDALKTATLNPAEYLNLSRELGTIEKGKLSDLILLDANPLDDIGNTTRIDAVVVNGRYISKEAREKMFSEVKATHDR